MVDKNLWSSASLMLLFLLVSCLSPSIILADSWTMEELHYVSPDATASGFSGLIVGTENNFDLLIMREGTLQRLVLAGIDIPQYDSSKLFSRRLLSFLRSTIGLQAAVQKTSSSKGSAAYIWIQPDGESYLIQSIIVSSGLGRAAGEGEIDLCSAEEYASNKALGIWGEELNIVEATIQEDIQQAETRESLQNESLLDAKLVISEIAIFENGEYAIIVLTASEGGRFDGSSLSIVSRSESNVDEDLFLFASEGVLEMQEQLKIFVTLDRSRQVTFDYDYLWESYLDPKGGYLRIRDRDGSESLFEYEYDRRISGFIVTPLD
ncbi:MAG: hypothetical protein JW701_05465 [Kosmotogaceae bacterium]|nr:hypothetical protein [Kosmotogaceae bacterium]